MIPMRLRTLLFLCALSLPVKAADVAMVDDELGQALLVSNRGLCYAVLPNHVSKTRDRIALAAPLPATAGAAEIFRRDPANDLALAYVEGAIGDRCTEQWNDLSRDMSRILQTAETGLIKSVHFGGEFFDRIAAALVDVDDTFISVKITDGGIDADVMQGLSGAMLSVDGQVAGIAIDASSTGEARFLRIDRIVSLLGADFASANHPQTLSIDDESGFRVTGFQGGDRAGVVALEAGGMTAPWVAQWTGDPIEFEITLSNDTLVPVNKIMMSTSVSEDATPARRIEVQIDRGLPGAAYWTPIASPDMSPTGMFDATTGGTVGRRLKIKIVDVWFPDRALRIDRLIID